MHGFKDRFVISMNFLEVLGSNFEVEVLQYYRSELLTLYFQVEVLIYIAAHLIICIYGTCNFQ